MNTVAIVKVIWIATVFATSALVSESLLESRTGAQIMVGRAKVRPLTRVPNLRAAMRSRVGEVDVGLVARDQAL